MHRPRACRLQARADREAPPRRVGTAWSVHNNNACTPDVEAPGPYLTGTTFLPASGLVSQVFPRCPHFGRWGDVGAWRGLPGGGWGRAGAGAWEGLTILDLSLLLLYCQWTQVVNVCYDTCRLVVAMSMAAGGFRWCCTTSGFRWCCTYVMHNCNEQTTPGGK